MDEGDEAKMRIVHLSDIHLGFRQYQRLAESGLNQREVDVARTFRRIIEKVIELRPDIVVVAGDVFHTVRPTNQAILHAYKQFQLLVQRLPESEFVIVAGNHDSPRTRETGCILNLFTPLGFRVAAGAPERFQLFNGDVSVLAVPDDSTSARPALTPDPSAKYNILLIHGEVEGIIPKYSITADRIPMTISKEELGAGRWDYVALGHYHVYRSVAPNAFYSGSLDYTSSNPWGEMLEEEETGIEGKGFIEHDLATGTHRFHHVAPERSWVDLPAISGAGLSAADLDARIKEALEGCEGGIADKVVRLVVRDVPRHIIREVDHKALREFRRTALHFHLDTRRPEIVRREGQGAPGRRQSLSETLRDSLRSRTLTSDLNRESLVELGLRYLQAAEAVAPASEVDAL
ncbi:MAG: DNA repair exonuclease [Gemmatimonadota bacterium]|nr:DNA repair exonuclease [Gemmatimonadota bacterium]